MKVIIKSISGYDGFNFRDMTIVEVDGEIIGSGRYGGEPEDNMQCRDYDWVEKLLKTLAEKLGAEVVMQEANEEETLKYFDRKL